MARKAIRPAKTANPRGSSLATFADHADNLSIQNSRVDAPRSMADFRNGECIVHGGIPLKRLLRFKRNRRF